MEDLGVISKMNGIASMTLEAVSRYDVVHSLCNATISASSKGSASCSTSGQGDIALLLEAKDSVETARVPVPPARGDDAALDPGPLRDAHPKGWAANPAPTIGKRHGVKATAANLLKRLTVTGRCAALRDRLPSAL